VVATAHLPQLFALIVDDHQGVRVRQRLEARDPNALLNVIIRV